MGFKQERTCKRCGKQFIATHPNQWNCNRRIEIPCEVCGNLMDSICTTAKSRKVTCSPECTKKLSMRSKIEGAAKQIRICKACGKEFIPKTARDAYCAGPHFRRCEVCGKEYEYNPKRKDAAKTCSSECRYKATIENRDQKAATEAHRRALMSKYGVDNSAKIPGASKKAKQTNLIRYGVESYTQTAEYKKRIKSTCRKKYGVDHHLQAEKVKAKRRATCRERYGCDNVFAAPEIKQKIGDSIESRYGVRNAGQRGIPDMVKWESFKQDPAGFIQSEFGKPVSIHDLANSLGVTFGAIQDHIDEDAKPWIHRELSVMEHEIFNIIRKLRPDLPVETHNRSIISPYELDIYVPGLRLAVECDPTATHNSTLGTRWDPEPKYPGYHKMKSDMCEMNGIRLLHVFGHDWEGHRLFVEDVIYAELGRICELSSAVCDVVPMDRDSTERFFEENSLEGFVGCDVALSLMSGDVIAECMSFMESEDGDWSISQHAWSPRLRVVGGPEMLFESFLREHAPNKVTAASDRATDVSPIYPALGFSEIGRSGPAPHVVELSSRTVDVYDSGTILWEWISSSM